MRYFRVYWTTADGIEHRSDPLVTWLDAAKFRSALIIDGVVTMPCAARIVGPY